MSQPPTASRNARGTWAPVAAHPVTSAVIAILIIASIFFSLYVPLYARTTPKVGDFPFFYFYLLVYMPAVSIALLIVIQLQKRLRPPGGAGRPAGGGRERGDQVSHVNATTFTIVLILFLVVTGVGFAAARWRRAEDMLHLNEWGLGGRGFGTFVSWFLLGGDLYTAYTFIAVPALVFGSGAIGFYAVSYTIMVFPIVIIFLPRLWSVSRVHDYVTPADFIRGRYGSRGLALSAAFTGILALMPYIALQLVGIQAVLTVMGVGTSSGNTFVKDLPLFIAFLVLAIFTYVSGLRAPALIAFIKDTLVYLMVIVAVFYIPTRLGGWGHIFGVAQTHLTSINPATKKPLRSVRPDLEGHRKHAARLRHARPGLSSGAFHLPALDYRDAGRQRGARWSSATWRTSRSIRSCSR